MAVLPIASSIFVLCLYIFHALPTARSTLGFSAELIHRDSPESPLYDPSSTAFSRFHAAIHRSTGRANYFRNLTVSTNSNSLLFPTVENKLISSDLTNYRGQYLMTLGIGDAEDEVKGKRPHWTRVLLDTGEPLTWVLCKPCKNCYKHKDPIFNPEASSMYKKIRCRSNACTIHDGPCRSESELCRYNNTYMDGFSINGVLVVLNRRLREMRNDQYLSGKHKRSREKKAIIQTQRILRGSARDAYIHGEGAVIPLTKPNKRDYNLSGSQCLDNNGDNKVFTPLHLQDFSTMVAIPKPNSESTL